MPASDTPTTASPDRVNELYWDSDTSVEEIVKELDISRRALYTAVRPVSAGRSCQECGERMVFANRTRRESGAATCLSCGAEFNAAKRSDSERASTPRRDPDHIGVPLPNRHSRGGMRASLAGVDPDRAIKVVGAAFLGVVLGVTTARIIQDL